MGDLRREKIARAIPKTLRDENGVPPKVKLGFSFDDLKRPSRTPLERRQYQQSQQLPQAGSSIASFHVLLRLPGGVLMTDRCVYTAR